MKIQEQTDEEIPTHIVSIVEPDASISEEELAREQRSRKSRKAQKSGEFLDVGLTVSENEKQDSQRKKKSIIEKDNTTPDPSDPITAEETGELLSQHKSINNEEEDKENVDVSGRSIFKFQQSVKKSSNSMMKKAMKEEVQEEASTSSRTKRTSNKRTTTEKEKAPDHAKRRRIQRQMELLNDTRDHDEQSNSENEEDKDKQSEDEEEEPEKKKSFLEQEGYERYFQDLHGTSKTSNNTLSSLQVLEPQQFHQLLKEAPKKHAQEIAILFEMHKQHFSQWFFELHSGFNLVFYGYGSKRNLLNKFAQASLTDGPLIVVNGFFPSISIKDILLKITAGALGTTGSTGNIQDHVKFICDYFASEDRDYESLYLLIHNLDGPNLRNERTQTALSMLANADNIHLVASVDHINAGLLWDNVKSSRFNWIWHDATTFDDYLVETSFENSLLVRTSELGGARGVKYVLDSLTSNARGMFKILAELQLVEMGISNMEGRGNEAVGLAYSQYYERCRDAYYVSSDIAFKTELTEFRDHKLISTKKSPDGTEIFFIPLDQTTLLSIIEQLD